MVPIQRLKQMAAHYDKTLNYEELIQKDKQKQRHKNKGTSP